MNWYDGEIINAVNESKTKQLIFLVYLHDPTLDESNKMNDLWNDENISGICNLNCVSLRLLANSEFSKQFNQICESEKYIN